jgi:hypothetical protein
MPDESMLARILDAHLPLGAEEVGARTERLRLIREFRRRAISGDLATDQLLNAVFMTVGPSAPLGPSVAVTVAGGESDETEATRAVEQTRQRLIDALLRHLRSAEPMEDNLGDALTP